MRGLGLGGLLLSLLLVAPPVFAWQEIRVGRVSILYEPIDVYYAGLIRRAVERDEKRVLAGWDRTPLEAVQIYLTSTIEQFDQLRPTAGYVPRWAAAVAYPDSRLVLVKSPRILKQQRRDLTQVTVHEMSHVLLHEILGPEVDIPHWLDEGVAMYEAKQWDLGNMVTLSRVSLADEFIPLHTLAQGFPVDPEEADQAYTQSFSFVSYLNNQYGPEAFREFLALFRASTNLNHALHETYGATLSRLEADWIGWVRVRYTWAPVITGSGALWFVLAWLIVAGYLRKRALSRRTLQTWELEEREKVLPFPPPDTEERRARWRRRPTAGGDST